MRTSRVFAQSVTYDIIIMGAIDYHMGAITNEIINKINLK